MIVVKMCPSPPRELCASEEDYKNGIISPSLYQSYLFGCMQHNENVDKYLNELNEYLDHFDEKICNKN